MLKCAIFADFLDFENGCCYLKTIAHKIRKTHGWLVGFVALRPKSTAMVIAGRSVHLTTLFLGQA